MCHGTDERSEALRQSVFGEFEARAEVGENVRKETTRVFGTRAVRFLLAFAPRSCQYSSPQDRKRTQSGWGARDGFTPFNAGIPTMPRNREQASQHGRVTSTGG